MDSPAVTRTFKVTDVIWLAWLAFAAFVTWPAMRWEFGYLQKTCPNFFAPFLVLLAVSPLLLIAWRGVRGRFLRRHEFAVVAGVLLAICIGYEPRAALVVMLVFSASFSAGRRLTRALGIETCGAAEDIAVSVTMGLGLLHCALFVIGLAGAYVWPVFAALLALPLLLYLRELRALCSNLRQIDAAWENSAAAHSWAGALLSASLLVLVFTAVSYALVPSTYFDLLNMHLPAARYYAAQHALVVPASLPYAYYPQSVETLMTLGYALAGQAAAQLLPGIYFSISMLLLIRIARMSGMSRFSSVTGVLFALCIPVLHWTGSAGKNDFALVMFLFGGLLAFLRWRETRQWGWILSGAFFLAMAAGVKHIVLFAVPPLLALYVYAAWRQPRRAWAITQVGGVLLAFGLFWHVRTWIATGNPVYPSVPVNAIQNTRPDRGVSVIRAHSVVSKISIARRIVWRYVRFPWDLHFHGQRYYESVSDYPMGIVLVLFAPAWLLVWKRLYRAGIVALCFAGAYLCYWAVSVGMIRYAIAPIAIICAFTAGWVVEFATAGTRLVRLSLFAACCYALLFSFCAIAIDEINRAQLRYFARRIDAREYLREVLPPYRALEFVRAAAKPGDAVLCVDACAAAYLAENMPFVCYTLNQPSGWKGVQALLSPGSFRFASVPRSDALDAPAGWTQKYADESFSVFAR